MTVAGLFDTVLAFFAAENWEVSPVDAQPAVSLEFQGQHGRWTCFAEIRGLQWTCVNKIPREDAKLSMNSLPTIEIYSDIH